MSRRRGNRTRKVERQADDGILFDHPERMSMDSDYPGDVWEFTGDLGGRGFDTRGFDGSDDDLSWDDDEDLRELMRMVPEDLPRSRDGDRWE